MDKKFLALIVALVALVVAVSGCTSNTSTTTNFTGNGYNFTYPSNWTVLTNGSSDDIAKIQKDTNTSFQVQKSALAGMTADQALNAEKQMPDNYKQISTSNLTIDGNTAYQTVYNVSSNGTTFKEVSIEFVKNNNIYYLTFMAPENTFDSDKATLDAIISSFKVQ